MRSVFVSPPFLCPWSECLRIGELVELGEGAGGTEVRFYF